MRQKIMLIGSWIVFGGLVAPALRADPPAPASPGAATGEGGAAVTNAGTKDFPAEDRAALVGIWTSLAKAKVLVSIDDSALGAPKAIDARARDFGWCRTLLAFAEASAGQEDLAGRIHEIEIGPTQDAGVTVDRPEGDDGPVVLLLDFALRPLGMGGEDSEPVLMCPAVVEIKKQLEALPPRKDLPSHRFDERWPLFLASHGVGFRIESPALRTDRGGKFGFHEVLASLGAKDSPALGRLLEEYLDRRYHPQVVLRAGKAPEVATAIPRLPSYPMADPVTHPRNYSVIFVTGEADGAWVAPEPGKTEQCLGDLIGNLDASRTSGTVRFPSESWSCGAR